MHASNAKRAKWSALLLGSIVFTAWAVIQVRAETTAIKPDIGFGMVGIAHAQTARLNLVNILQPDGNAGLPPGPCRARLMFLDSEGAVLKMSDVSLAPGHAGFLDVTRRDTPSDGGRPGTVGNDADRQQIRAVWQAFDDPYQCGPEVFIATVEVFGRDGRTTVLFTGPED